MPYSRAHIRLNNTQEANEFVKMINSDGTADKYTIEDFNGKQRVNARSLIGVIYALTDFNDEMYLVNDSSERELPCFIDKYRV